MDLVRLCRTDLEDLRNLLLYLKENGMQIDDINDMIYYLGRKYEFDPFRYEINLLTGIVSVRNSHYQSFEELSTNTQKQPAAQTILSTSVLKSDAIVEKLDNGKKMNPAIHHTNASQREPTIDDYIKEFSYWIKRNQLDLITVRKMISMIEKYRRLEEVSPDEFHELPEEIIELIEWLEARGLNYLKLRMMLTIIAQKEANLNRETVIAR